MPSNAVVDSVKSANKHTKNIKYFDIDVNKTENSFKPREKKCPNCLKRFFCNY
jgi:hypothetical protein